MTEKYKGKYRSETFRAQWWDYASNAPYFITICTNNREHFFGEIRDGKMDLSPIGHFANSCWHEIPKHFPFVELGAFIVMPNHIHGIIVINKPDTVVAPQNIVELRDTVGTQNFVSQQQQIEPQPFNKFGPQSQNLASIVRGYKVGVTKNARLINPDFGWQSRYHDHIVRNDAEFDRIATYIINNPSKWEEDKFH